MKRNRQSWEGLESVEARLLVYKKNESVYEDDIKPIVSEPIVKKPIVEPSEAKASADKPKVVRKNFGPPLIKDWISDSEDEAESKSKIEKKTVKLSFAKIKFVKSKEQVKSHRKTTVKQVADSVAAALKAQAANMANTGNTNRNPKPIETPAARKLFSHRNCTKDCKVKFATGTLTEDALSWWNSYAKPIGIEQADKITWTELKRLLTNKYCPRTEVRKMEDEFYNLDVKGNVLKTYARIF
nr:reverse transcriptase domain-containing protein [Tanacetum cinerariifolium]